MGVVYGLKSALDSIYNISGVGRILIIKDENKLEVADIFERAIERSNFNGILVELFLNERPLKKMPKELIEDIRKFKPEVTITIFEAYPQEREIRIRLLRELTKFGKVAHCPGITKEMLRENGPFDIDYEKMKRNAEILKKLLKKYNEFEIITDNYSLNLRTDGRTWYDDFTVKSFGNLPAGEIFIAPLENMVNGEIIVKHRAGEHILNEPVLITWKDGKIIGIKSEDKKIEDLLRGELGRYKYNNIIGEFGLGFNQNADPKAEILESEKRGPHIARGPSKKFGSIYDCNDHEDYLLPDATVIANGNVIYENGVLSKEIKQTFLL